MVEILADDAAEKLYKLQIYIFWNFLKKQRITMKYDKFAVRLSTAQANDKSGQGSKVMMMTFLIVAPEILRMSGPSADQQANNFQPGLQAAPDTNTTRSQQLHQGLIQVCNPDGPALQQSVLT